MNRKTSNGQGLALVGPVRIEGGPDHPYAADRLRACLQSVEWMVDPIGSQASTGATLRLQEDPALPEGSYEIEVWSDDSGARVHVTGGPISGVIQGVEWVLRSATAGTQGITLPHGQVEVTPKLRYRSLWTWDHSTHWDVDSFGLQETGAFNPYGKQPEAFVGDYERMIDFMSQHGLGAVVIYGLLRDSHGGVEAANRICRYARARGVRVLAGVAVNSYGGIYYEGQHRFNLATWLRQHPELAADTAAIEGFRIDDYGYLGFPHGDFTLAARSDRPEMERWHLEGLEWLLQTVDVDGINFEFGDYAGNDHLADMRRLLPGLVETAQRQRDGLWLIAELGWDFLAAPDAAERIRGLPEGCAYQFTYNRSYWPTLKSTLTSRMIEQLPTTTNLIRPHAGSQWNQQRYAYMAPSYVELARLAASTGLIGATIFGEVSDYSVPNELNYLAFARFCIEDDLSWERFIETEVEPRLGGTAPTLQFLELLERFDADELDLNGLLSARDLVRSTAATLADPQRRRWSWLDERLSRRIHSRLDR